MPLKFSCPACGADLIFKSSITVYGVCASCKSTVVRSDDGVNKIGEMADVPDDLSPLQIGSIGNYNGKPFEILGRLKILWAEGSWNEWYCVFAGGKEGWLAEAQGFWGLCFEVDHRGIEDCSQKPVNAVVQLGKQGRFSVDDIKKNVIAASEGELPFKAPVGLERICIDLVGDGGSFATYEKGADRTKLFVGRYVSLRDLRMKNLREIEGWPRWKV